MKKNHFLLMACMILLVILIMTPSCRKEIYTDKDALEAMKEAIKYKNDLEKELLALELTNQLQLDGLRTQLSMKEMRAADSLQKIGAKVSVNVQIVDVTGSNTNMSGFTVVTNQSGVASTKTTDANGMVVFPDCIQGSASFVVTKTGFVRASGILIISNDYENSQKAIVVPVFPVETSTGKISGTLTAQLDLTTEAPEPVKNGIVTLSFDDIWDMFYNPNSTLSDLSDFGLAGITYDGGFMQTVKTGSDGKYEFKVPKTKNVMTYNLYVSTIQKNQKLLFGDYPTKLDSMKLDSMKVYFGYNSWNAVFHDNVGYYDNNNNYLEFPGVNIKIDAPEGGQTPTAAADIDWAHNDSTVVTWSFTKFSYGDGSDEITSITQAPVFDYHPNLAKVRIVTPTAGSVNIVNGKLVSLYMTNGGEYKEYGRFFGINGNVAPTQNSGTKFKFLEGLSQDDQANWGNPDKDTTYQTAIAKATVILHKGVVKVAFKTKNDWVTSMTRTGKGYTAVPNVQFRLQTPHTGDSTLTGSNLKVNLLPGGGLSIDTLVLSKYTNTAGFVVLAQPVFATYKRNGNLMGGNYYVTANPSSTYKVSLSNGLKIKDGGLGYTTAPRVRIENYAKKQGSVNNSWTKMTIAEASTVLDAQGRIIAVSDPVMTDNLMLQSFWDGTSNRWNYDMVSAWPEFISVPTDVTGKNQAYARAVVDESGIMTAVYLYNETDQKWYPSGFGGYLSGKGYVSTPKVKVTPVGKTSVTKTAQLQAVVNSSGRISNIIIVDGGKGYDVRNNANAKTNPGSLTGSIETNGSSDFVYNINMGSGWHGDANDIF